MKWPFKKKQPVFFEYKFLCKYCDIFFVKSQIDHNKCPICNRQGVLWSVHELSNREK